MIAIPADFYSLCYGDYIIKQEHEMIEFIRSSLIFNSMSTLMIATISRHLQKVVMKSSEYVYQEGSPSKAIYFLESGQILMLKKPTTQDAGTFTVKVAGHNPVKLQMVDEV